MFGNSEESGLEKYTNKCVICSSDECYKIVDLFFSPSKYLPQTYEYFYCEKCSFGFSRPLGLSENNLNRYYAENENDHSLDFNANGKRFREQWAHMSELINQYNDLLFKPTLKILDFGAGNCQLLIHISERVNGIETAVAVDTCFSNQEYRNSIQSNCSANINFYSSLESLEEKSQFDIIILSHVLEHLSVFILLHDLRERLSSDGVLLIEIPDAERYHDFTRKSPFYYLDRLHINHFSLTSLVLLLHKFNFSFQGFKRYTFDYNDQRPYPALLAIFCQKKNWLVELSHEENCRLSFIESKFISKEVAVWGCGDNFHRLKGLGFFKNLKILFYVDKSLESNDSFDSLPVTTLEVLSKTHPGITVLVTISWNVSELVDWARFKFPNLNFVQI